MPTVNGTCRICGRKAFARGLCQKHWARWRRHGDPLTTRRTYEPIERLQKHVEITGFCWLWKGKQNSRGYGRVSVHQVRLLAHRWVYELLVGPIPKDLVLDHLCRIRRCVNPDHLEPVTQAVNKERSRGLAYCEPALIDREAGR